ncbi:BAG family molecular chaperone regulator 6-like [Mangifera indica]|uniref:BAG family molecular chaperone regulator 6-like n=1 Tax=Mangifera indica TaxID=29780 RepID=UPI001CFB4E80|nr:BAG family molecular chaperone regulator 6-like [Mangifera indica]
MDSPFYKSYWNMPSRPHQVPTVREIPVHYVGSEQPVDRSVMAVRIEKAFRGFLVRKSVKKIVEIRRQVEEIEKLISDKETVDLIKRDGKERLRINEMLMSLLFKLDSVRGVDSGVRDFRKAVIKKAISLQETIDAIVSGNADVEFDQAEKIIEAINETVMECAEDGENRDGSAKDNAEPEQVGDKEIKEVVDNQRDDVGEEIVENCELKAWMTECLEESVGTNQTESVSDSSANPQNSIESCEEDVNSSSKDEIDAVETHQAEVKEVSGKEYRAGEENSKNRELLEKMIEDNEKMMDMMAKLFERNEMQTKLLSSLSHRVEQLEKAFVCERLRRKKKRNSGTVDSCETIPDNKKCGKRS